MTGLPLEKVGLGLVAPQGLPLVVVQLGSAPLRLWSGFLVPAKRIFFSGRLGSS